MPLPPDIPPAPEFDRSFAESLVSLVASPAALVADGESVVAMNAAWAAIAGDRSTATASAPRLAECLVGFSGGDAMVAHLRTGSQSGSGGSGVLKLLRPREPEWPKGTAGREYIARWRQVPVPGRQRTYALIVLEQAVAGNLASVINSQRASIDDLLIRQTLIEERERRRLGIALHDGIVQELALLRNRLLRADRSQDRSPQLIEPLDSVIDRLRRVAFELSPPILEDLGLQPALHWLAEHLNERYRVGIEVADDGREPPLTSPTRTIVFRAVRELAINAAKHAPGAEIILSCATGSRSVRLGVRDTGPGFAPASLHHSTDGLNGFGLLSVEQQIRTLGGSFELMSHVGEGTRATIMVPLELAKSAAHG